VIATASEAVDALRHKRTGEILPTKNVARNTKLVYYDDELVGLKFHNTVIARFTTNGCDDQHPRSVAGRDRSRLVDPDDLGAHR
jgi:hypothetical protein